MSKGNAKELKDHEPAAVIYAREKAGLTKADVARELGVTLSLISQIESGKRNATPAMIRRLAQVFNCPVVILERKKYATVATDTETDEDAA
jgi:transcriptional regulator with XRE-family HTH domain